mmetsp:Transcript_23449/g.59854  ORF Transcript_23449/g.59854 Transcript_23449/m.59854 type:complete len:276 (-) Transcript_23449:3411-4238(-)
MVSRLPLSCTPRSIRNALRRVSTSTDPMDRASVLFEGVVNLQEAWLTTSPHRLRSVTHNAAAGPSTRHELGVFASRDLGPHTLSSFYPVHAIGYGEIGAAINEDSDYFAGLDSPSAYRVHLLHNDAELNPPPGLWIDANPERDHIPGWLGHLANDAATCKSASEADILAYYSACHSIGNSVLVPFGGLVPIMALCTTRPVSKGEELLISYGHNFWLEHQYGALVEPTASIAEACDAQGRLMAEVARTLAMMYEVELGELAAMLATGGLMPRDSDS